MHMESCRILPGQTGHEAGRALLARLYAAHIGGPLPEIRIQERGKPYFVNSPVHFSISHTKDHVFCVLSDRPVGIDGEEENRQINLKLAEKILSPEEWAQYSQAEDPRIALLTFWVLKEAAAKCTGEGLRGYPEKGNFTLDDPRVQKLDGCIVAVVEEETHVI